MSENTTAVRRCTPGDLDTLIEFCTATFRDTYQKHNTAENMDAYIERWFNRDQLKRDLENEAIEYYFLYDHGELAGYIKLNHHAAQTDIHDPQSLEVERIYVAKSRQKRGLGRALMDIAVARAQVLCKDYIWLGVWEKNQNAIAFYSRSGFYTMGEHRFMIGDELQNDYILKKDIDGEDANG